jgi:hypothetical protein
VLNSSIVVVHGASSSLTHSVYTSRIIKCFRILATLLGGGVLGIVTRLQAGQSGVRFTA